MPVVALRKLERAKRASGSILQWPGYLTVLALAADVAELPMCSPFQARLTLAFAIGGDW